MLHLFSNYIGVALGSGILALVGYINWRGSIKANSVRWIGKHICQPIFGDERLADTVFMGATAYILAVGALLVIFSLP